MVQSVFHEVGDPVGAAHYQIGNSLQSVASLLMLQGRATEGASRAALFDASRRVGVIMHLHTRLQAGSAGADVCLDDLLGDVCRDVAELDSIDRNATLNLDFHPMLAPPRIAAALAQIVAELVGNALEHGLRDLDGSISVTLVSTAGGCRIGVSDDGTGGIEAATMRSSFGLTLVNTLVRQVGGLLELRRGARGTAFDLTVPGVYAD